jgi:hypothetical protein
MIESKKKSHLPAHTTITMIVPLAAMYSCVCLSINTWSIGRPLLNIEDIVWWLSSHYHYWCSVFQTTRRQLFTCSPEWMHWRSHCSRLLRKSSAGTHEVHSPLFPFPFLNAWLHLQTITFDSVFSPYCLFNLEHISDGLQPSFVRNVIRTVWQNCRLVKYLTFKA